MKIIKRSNYDKHWWVGQQVNCGHCASVLELELADASVVAAQANRASVVCPECGGITFFSPPRKGRLSTVGRVNAWIEGMQS